MKYYECNVCRLKLGLQNEMVKHMKEHFSKEVKE